MNEALFNLHPIVLEDERVKLEPIEAKHFHLLLPVALQPDLWRFTTVNIQTEQDFKAYFDTALLEQQNRVAYPFVIYDKQRQQYAGSTRFGNIDLHNKRLEIGWTWVDQSLHGTGFNKHCKFLLLRFGFETLGLNRIELKTSLLNLRSQKAMQKIGAVQEGILRKHMINADGSRRDSVYFSFINDEWPAIKQTIFSAFPQ